MRRTIGGLVLLAALVPAMSSAAVARTEQQAYVGASKAWPNEYTAVGPSCDPGGTNIGGACFDVVAGEAAVTIDVADVRASQPVLGEVVIHWPPRGDQSPSFMRVIFCGSVTVALPDDATSLRVGVGITPSLVGLPAACGSATEGTISAIFSNT